MNCITSVIIVSAVLTGCYSANGATVGGHINESEQNKYESLSKTQLIGSYLVIDDFVIRFDSVNISNFNPKWIEKIEFIKDEKYKSIYGDTGGKIYIYPKKRFKKILLKSYKYD